MQAARDTGAAAGRAGRTPVRAGGQPADEGGGRGRPGEGQHPDRVGHALELIRIGRPQRRPAARQQLPAAGRGRYRRRAAGSGRDPDPPRGLRRPQRRGVAELGREDPAGRPRSPAARHLRGGRCGPLRGRRRPGQLRAGAGPGHHRQRQAAERRRGQADDRQRPPDPAGRPGAARPALRIQPALLVRTAMSIRTARPVRRRGGPAGRWSGHPGMLVAGSACHTPLATRSCTPSHHRGSGLAVSIHQVTPLSW